MSIWGSGGVPLFLQCDPPGFEAAGATLVLHGVDGSGRFGGVDLYMNCEFNGPADNEIPLSVRAPSGGTTSGNMNLWVGGEYAAANGGCDLALWNAGRGAASGVTLFLQGSGTNDGYSPSNNNMNLVLRRKPADGITLFLASHGEPVASGMTAYVQGAEGEAAGMTLAVPYAVGPHEAELKLFTRGSS